MFSYIGTRKMQVKAVMLIQLPKSTQMPALVLKTENFCQNGVVELLADFVSYVYVLYLHPEW